MPETQIFSSSYFTRVLSKFEHISNKDEFNDTVTIKLIFGDEMKSDEIIIDQKKERISFKKFLYYPDTWHDFEVWKFDLLFFPMIERKHKIEILKLLVGNENKLFNEFMEKISR